MDKQRDQVVLVEARRTLQFLYHKAYSFVRNFTWMISCVPQPERDMSRLALSTGDTACVQSILAMADGNEISPRFSVASLNAESWPRSGCSTRPCHLRCKTSDEMPMSLSLKKWLASSRALAQTLHRWMRLRHLLPCSDSNPLGFCTSYKRTLCKETETVFNRYRATLW